MKTVLAEIAPTVADPARWDLARQSLAQRSGGALRDAITQFRHRHDSWKEAAEAFAQVAQASAEGMALSELLAALQTIQDNKEHLQDWTRWVEVRRPSQRRRAWAPRPCGRGRVGRRRCRSSLYLRLCGLVVAAGHGCSAGTAWFLPLVARGRNQTLPGVGRPRNGHGSWAGPVPHPAWLARPRFRRAPI